MTKTNLKHTDIWEYGLLSRDKAGRWEVDKFSPEAVVKYIEKGNYRKPSRAWPQSHFKPLLTKKFAKWVIKEDAQLAEKLGLA